jgi:hypothetical protein
MKKRLFFLTKLREGVEPEDYERFLREVDYPETLRLLPVSYYRATRLTSRIVGEGDLPYQYIEVIDVDDYEAYLAALADMTPEVKALFDGVMSHLGEVVDLAGDLIE